MLTRLSPRETPNKPTLAVNPAITREPNARAKVPARIDLSDIILL